MKDAITILRMDGKANSQEYKRYAICEKMGWDYYTYESQPPFFLEEIEIFLIQEALKQKEETRKINRSTTKK